MTKIPVPGECYLFSNLVMSLWDMGQIRHCNHQQRRRAACDCCFNQNMVLMTNLSHWLIVLRLYFNEKSFQQLSSEHARIRLSQLNTLC